MMLHMSREFVVQCVYFLAKNFLFFHIVVWFVLFFILLDFFQSILTSKLDYAVFLALGFLKTVLAPKTDQLNL